MSGDEHHFYEPRNGHGLPHDPFNAIVGPRPIGWISTIGATGVRNLAPYSFFNAFNYVPPIVGFSSVGWKDSVENISATGEFVWNLVTRPQAEMMNATSASFAEEIDEFEECGVPFEASTVVKPDRVVGAPVAFECRSCQIVQLEAAGGSLIETWMVFAEVVGVHIARSALRDGIYQTALPAPILRGGGPGDFFEITEANRFFMPRPA